MSTIVTRAAKGSALTHNEVDANFVNLNTDKVEKAGTDPVSISVNSTSDALRITQTGTGNAFVVEDSTSPDSSPFVIDASGNVILGRLSAITAPDYNGTQRTSTGFQSLRDSYALSTNVNALYAAVNGSSSYLFAKSRDATVGGQTIVTTADILGVINFAGSDGAAFINGASITAAVDGTPGLNDMPGRLVFSTTADGASSPTERMRIDSAGQIAIGGAPLNGASVRLIKDMTGGSNAYGYISQGVVQSDVTSLTSNFYSASNTEAAAFTLPTYTHYVAAQGTIGAGSSITNQYGFSVSANLTGATNNYGFYSNIAAGTGRYNFCANGTADNYFAGNVQFATGSAASPALTNISDKNTGIFFPAADTIAFAEGGVETMRLDSTGNLKFNSGYGSVATAYGCRAWVNFNGTGTVAIRASGNVSSITDNGVGDYTVNFATAMVDINYSYSGNHSSGSGGVSSLILNNAGATAPTTTSARIGTYISASSVDPVYINMSFFR